MRFTRVLLPTLALILVLPLMALAKDKGSGTMKLGDREMDVNSAVGIWNHNSFELRVFLLPFSPTDEEREKMGKGMVGTVASQQKPPSGWSWVPFCEVRVRFVPEGKKFGKKQLGDMSISYYGFTDEGSSFTIDRDAEQTAAEASSASCSAKPGQPADAKSNAKVKFKGSGEIETSMGEKYAAEWSFNVAVKPFPK